MKSPALKRIRIKLQKHASSKKAKLLQRFFKTGPGEYAEGDIFIGVTVPKIRQIAKEYRDLGLKDSARLLKSKIHEERLLALILLVLRYLRADGAEKEKIYRIYLANTRYINNWDLVDLTAQHIVGAYLDGKDKRPLYTLAKSELLWERRIAVLSTFYYIRKGEPAHTLKIAGILLKDRHDLIHKAAGWMLREVGKRDLAAEEGFLRKYHAVMPRTMLRYAIEKFPEPKRRNYLKGDMNYDT